MNDTFFVKTIYAVFGSWWSVIGHTILFIMLIAYFKDMLLFTTFVSIEAIYYGIFILMAANREESLKMQKAQLEREKDRKLVKEDVNITQHVMTEVDQIHCDLAKLIEKYK